MLFPRAARYSGSIFVAIALVAVLPSRATAQQAEPANPNSERRITVTTGMDFLNAYMFRGIQRDDTNVIMWPYIDLGLTVFSGNGGLKSLGLNIGSWNSLHPGAAGIDGPSGKLWYEGDFYATLGLGFGGGVRTDATYTAYTSPNDMFSTVMEIAFKVSLDDTSNLGAVLKPYGVVASELETLPGVGQFDNGNNAGTYLELGAAPGWAADAVSVAFPAKVGLSLRDYYELDGVDNRFGYFSLAGIVIVPLGRTTSFGAWNIHGGVELQTLGKTTRAINNGSPRKVIGSIGLGLSY